MTDKPKRDVAHLWGFLGVVVGGLIVFSSNIGIEIYKERKLRSNIYASISAQSEAILLAERDAKTAGTLKFALDNLRKGADVQLDFLKVSTVPNVIEQNMQNLGLLDPETARLAFRVRLLTSFYNGSYEYLRSKYSSFPIDLKVFMLELVEKQLQSFLQAHVDLIMHIRKVTS